MPANAFVANTYILEIADFKFIKTDEWLDPKLYDLPDSKPLNVNFEETGYEDAMLMGNMSELKWTLELSFAAFIMYQTLNCRSKTQTRRQRRKRAKALGKC